MARMRVLGAISGLLAALAGIGAGEGFAALIDGPSPVVAVGTWAIDTSPAWLRTWAIDNFGVNDKQVLVSGVLATIAVLGGIAGAVGVTHRRFALGFAVVIGVIGLLATATVRGVDDPIGLRITPALLAILVATVGLGWMLAGLDEQVEAAAQDGAAAEPGGRPSVTDRAAPAPAAPSALEQPAVMIPGRRPLAAPRDLDRRTFVRAAGVVGVVGITGGTIWQTSGGGLATTGLVTLPRPLSPAKAVTGADFNIPGLTPYFTANNDFYRIDTALAVPRLQLGDWKMRIHGLIDNPITLTFDDLLKADLIERDVTLMCVSNEIGGYYNGNARWLGVRIADVLREAGVQAGADAVKSTSSDGWTCGTPLSALTDPNRDAMFAIGMNGDTLPYDHGFPVRMVVPGLYGFVSATKWIVDFEVTRFDEFEAYWTKRGWAEQAPVKTQSRLEVPQPYLDLPAGRTTLAGMAWAQHRGISKVEVLIDDEVRVAELAPWNNIDTWRQWRIRDWKATPGTRNLAVRATDGTGAVQTAETANPVPDGASGYHYALYPVR